MVLFVVLDTVVFVLDVVVVLLDTDVFVVVEVLLVDVEDVLVVLVLVSAYQSQGTAFHGHVAHNHTSSPHHDVEFAHPECKDEDAEADGGLSAWYHAFRMAASRSATGKPTAHLPSGYQAVVRSTVSGVETVPPVTLCVPHQGVALVHA